VRTAFFRFARGTADPGSLNNLEVLLRDSVSVLCEFLLRPEPEAWVSPAHGLALAFSGGTVRDATKIDPQAMPALLHREITEIETDIPAGEIPVIVRRTARGAVVVLEMRSPQDVRAWLAVDDRDNQVGTAEQVGAWRDWLAVSNLLQFLMPGRFHAYTTTTAAISVSASDAADPLPGPWRDIHEVSDDAVRGLILALATAGVPVPVAGHEVDDGEHSIDLAWPEQRLAVVIGEDVDRDAWLAANGWTVIATDEHAVRMALGAAGAGV
jgi:hypothetical protein